MHTLFLFVIIGDGYLIIEDDSMIVSLSLQDTLRMFFMPEALFIFIGVGRC